MRDDYFNRLLEEERELKAHGFDHYPTEDELMRYAFGLEDRLKALCQALGVTVQCDCCGYWHVLRAEDDDAYGY